MPPNSFTCQKCDQPPRTLDPAFLLLTELVSLAWGATRLPLQTPQALLTARWSFTTRFCKDVCGKLKTPVSPSSLWEPCRSCVLKAGILTNVVPKTSSVQAG